MVALKDIAAYLCANTPSSCELSKGRLTKMVYLADWKSAIERNHQITGILWKFNHYGPFVEDIMDAVEDDRRFEIADAKTDSGAPKKIIRLRDRRDLAFPTLTKDVTDVLDFVIQATAHMEWSAFLRLVYSTYPIVTQPRYSDLDLVRLAQAYRKTWKVLESPDSGPIQARK